MNDNDPPHWDEIGKLWQTLDFETKKNYLKRYGVKSGKGFSYEGKPPIELF